ncbi:hypothetical protein CM49_06663 [Paenibacillus sp. P1XP2]|nr:hypothetical protein CM49_06663 [Paenibacillus sp. P1XP2]
MTGSDGLSLAGLSAEVTSPNCIFQTKGRMARSVDTLLYDVSTSWFTNTFLIFLLVFILRSSSKLFNFVYYCFFC